MKTPQLPAKGKVPKAQTRWAIKPSFETELHLSKKKWGLAYFPVAVLPTQTRQQAAQLVRFMRMDEEGRIEQVAWAICAADSGATVAQAKSIINVLSPHWFKLARALLLLCGLITKGAK